MGIKSIGIIYNVARKLSFSLDFAVVPKRLFTADLNNHITHLSQEDVSNPSLARRWISARISFILYDQ
jgi:hypothetical protein